MAYPFGLKQQRSLPVVYIKVLSSIAQDILAVKTHKQAKNIGELKTIR
jgi:hypothetical protein